MHLVEVFMADPASPWSWLCDAGHVTAGADELAGHRQFQLGVEKKFQKLVTESLSNILIK
jgi:hypothetical protein